MVVLLLNPPHKNHWIIKRWFNLDPSPFPEAPAYYMPVLKEEYKESVCYIHTTYKNNKKNINKSTLENFARYKATRPDHYYPVIEGLVSEGARGRIFTNWKRISDKEYDELPYTEKYALDFGFSNHPAALVGIKEHNNSVYVREYIYKTGLTNPALAREMDRLGVPRSATIIADSAEPKSIQELVESGFNVVPAEKGNDSIRAGIDKLLDTEVYYTDSSSNIEMETQEYKWKLDRNKEPTNEPIDENNHAMDAIRYGTSKKVSYVGFA